jgi:hypothetical protein
MSSIAIGNEVIEPIKVWQCIGCGRIDHPQPCVGVCQDRKAEIVPADALRAAADKIRLLEAVVRRMATITPRAGESERTYRALQEEARKALAAAGL